METTQACVTRVTSVTSAGFICHWWCHIRHWQGILGDEERLVLVTRGSEAEPEKPRALVIIPVLTSYEAELLLEEGCQQSVKASVRERFTSGVIDPGAVIGVEPDILMFIVVAAVHLMGTPDIHHSQCFALVILAVIQDERLVGPFRKRIRIDE